MYLFGSHEAKVYTYSGQCSKMMYLFWSHEAKICTYSGHMEQNDVPIRVTWSKMMYLFGSHEAK